MQTSRQARPLSFFRFRVPVASSSVIRPHSVRQTDFSNIGDSKHPADTQQQDSEHHAYRTQVSQLFTFHEFRIYLFIYLHKLAIKELDIIRYTDMQYLEILNALTIIIFWH